MCDIKEQEKCRLRVIGHPGSSRRVLLLFLTLFGHQERVEHEHVGEESNHGLKKDQLDHFLGIHQGGQGRY